MKQLTLIFIFLFSILNANAQVLKDQSCHFGFTFEISTNPNWGYGEPVVLSVEPYSAAEKAGIKASDIIMEINGSATYLRDYRTIANWLFDSYNPKAVFTIRNMHSYFKEYPINRICNEVASLSESELATSFSMYSVENTQERAFSLPLSVSATKDVDYSDYHTFNFLPDPNAPAIDAEITEIIEKSLLEKGLVRSLNDPDMIIQIYYSYQPNLKYNAARKSEISPRSWRYDPRSQSMVLLPILSGEQSTVETAGQFALGLGIRFFDRKYIDPTQLTQIWDCHSVEYLSSKYSLEEYARIHTPLILMTFPYQTNTNSVNYVVSYKKYNYTGLHFSADDLKRITDVDEDSPAFRAGLRGNDVVTKIGDIKFNSTKSELTNAYKRFIIETMKFRDVSTRFTDANGYADCMYWDKYEYNKIAKEFKKDIYLPNFSYLYGFEKYVDSEYKGVIPFEVQTRKQKRSFTVKPEVRTAVNIRIK